MKICATTGFSKMGAKMKKKKRIKSENLFSFHIKLKLLLMERMAGCATDGLRTAFLQVGISNLLKGRIRTIMQLQNSISRYNNVPAIRDLHIASYELKRRKCL